MGGWRGETTKLGHRTPRTRALDVGTNPSGFSSDSDYDEKAGRPKNAAHGTPNDEMGEIMGEIKNRGEPAPRAPAGRVK